MNKFLTILILLTVNNVLSQNNGLKNYYKTLNYNSIYKIDLDIDRWEFQNYYNSSIILDINENGSGRIIIYYSSKHIYYIDRNYKITYPDGGGTYFFIGSEGTVFRLGITPENFISVFSVVLKDNTTISFVNK